MARYRGPKNRIARRFGVNIFGRAKNPLVHRSHPPGMHGAKRKKKSDYGVHLEEKQKLKAAFGMLSEAQLMRYFAEAVQRRGNTPEIFLQLLETRLDIVAYRLRFAPTIFAAQQLVAHGHLSVNGKRVTCRSFQVKPGMQIQVREKSRQNKMITESLLQTHKAVPGYLHLDEKQMTGSLVGSPALETVPFPLEIDLAMICDFLAHGG